MCSEEPTISSNWLWVKRRSNGIASGFDFGSLSKTFDTLVAIMHLSAPEDIAKRIATASGVPGIGPSHYDYLTSLKEKTASSILFGINVKLEFQNLIVAL